MTENTTPPAALPTDDTPEAVQQNPDAVQICADAVQKNPDAVRISAPAAGADSVAGTKPAAPAPAVPAETLRWVSGAQRGLCARGCGRSDRQLNSFDYLADVPGNDEISDLVEVQFKNTRKGYYRNDNRLKLEKGDMVAVESSPGHDIGVVTLTGSLVPLQMRKSGPKTAAEVKRIYRKARPADMEKYEEAKSREHATMIQARQIAADLELNMKIGDVEYQGDCNKAIFYYIADGRVDFRKLIKVLAEAFHVRIEMKQIGARQEAGRIGGIGPCGRELCCATWMKRFVSVSTAAARFQDISPNPQKLAGQCAKLKCCLNYEVDAYVEAYRKLPSPEVQLETADGTYYYFKADILSGLVTYSTDKRLAANLVTIPRDRAFEIIRLNKQGEKPLRLDEEGAAEESRSKDLLDQDDLTRFDKAKRRKNKKRRSAAPAEGAPAAGEAQGENTGGGRSGQRRERGERRGGGRARGPRREGGDGGQRREGGGPRNEGGKPRGESAE